MVNSGHCIRCHHRPQNVGQYCADCHKFMINRPIATLYDFWGKPVIPDTNLIISYLSDSTYFFTIGTVKRIFREEDSYLVRVELHTDTGRVIHVTPEILRNHAARPEDAEAWTYGTNQSASVSPDSID